jgi:hypothetical protein
MIYQRSFTLVKKDLPFWKTKPFWLNYFGIVLFFTGFVVFKFNLDVPVSSDDPYRIGRLSTYLSLVFGGFIQAALAVVVVLTYEAITYIMFGLQRKFDLASRFTWALAMPFNFIFYYSSKVSAMDNFGLSAVIAGILAAMLASGFQLYVLKDKTNAQRSGLFFVQLIWGWGAMIAMAFVQSYWMRHILESSNQI